MTIHPGYVGIDISKNTLDIFETLDQRAQKVANDQETAEKLAKAWRKAGVFVLFEATGHYDTVLRKALLAAGVPFHRVNPSDARHFAKAARHLAKTDAIDARMLARMAQAMQPRPSEPISAEREQLAELHKRRDQLVAMRQQEQTRRTECRSAGIAAGLDRHLAWLQVEIHDTEQQIEVLIAHSRDLTELCRLLRSIPGVGPVAAVTLLSLMPELGSRSPKELAALAGLAPFNNDSGEYQGQRKIQGGRSRVRRALYMAALAASHSRKGRLVEKYQSLRKAGKKPKVAFIALARKILTIANAVIRDRQPFQHA